MAELTYFEFAENDYHFFRDAYDAGFRNSSMAAIGQSICEKYLKDIIDKYVYPETPEENYDKSNVLHTHSLRRLMTYIEENMGTEISAEARSLFERINGFYHTTRYPGDESFLATAEDIDLCMKAAEYARAINHDIVEELSQDEPDQDR